MVFSLVMVKSHTCPIYIYMYILIHIVWDTHTYVYIYIISYNYIHYCDFPPIYIYIYTYCEIPTHIYIYIYKYIYVISPPTNIYIYIYIYTSIHGSWFFSTSRRWNIRSTGHWQHDEFDSHESHWNDAISAAADVMGTLGLSIGKMGATPMENHHFSWENPLNHHFSWENPLFLWWFSIAILT